MSFLDDVRKRAKSNCKVQMISYEAGEDLSFISKNYPFSKILILLDSYSSEWYPLFKADHPSAIVVIRMSGDSVDPLFSLSDGLSLVIVCGATEVVSTARYFCTILNIPCIYYPFGVEIGGIVREYVAVKVAGETIVYPAVYPNMIFVGQKGAIKRINALKKEAYGALIGARVCMLEERYFSLFERKNTPASVREDLFTVACGAEEKPFSEMTVQDLFYLSYLLYCSYERLPFKSEFERLYSLYKKNGFGHLSPLVAGEKLTALYGVFFESGVYRKYYTTPYHRRIKESAKLFNKTEETVAMNVVFPLVEETVLKYEVFTANKERFLPLVRELKRRYEWYADNIKENVEIDHVLANKILKYLPESAREYGLTCLMRDFGLMDF